MASAIRCRRPSASLSRNGQEFGQRVPPTSTIATSRRFRTGLYHRLSAQILDCRGIARPSTDGRDRRLARGACDLGGRPAPRPCPPPGRPRAGRAAEDRDRLPAHLERGSARFPPPPPPAPMSPLTRPPQP